MATLALSKSKKGILVYPGDGSVYLTSVAWVEMLIAGKARGNLIVLQEMKGASDNGIGNVATYKQDKAKEGAFDFNKIEE